MHKDQPKANHQKLILGKEKALADLQKEIELSFCGTLLTL